MGIGPQQIERSFLGQSRRRRLARRIDYRVNHRAECRGHACLQYLFMTPQPLISTQNVLYVEDNEKNPAIHGCSLRGANFFRGYSQEASNRGVQPTRLTWPEKRVIKQVKSPVISPVKNQKSPLRRGRAPKRLVLREDERLRSLCVAPVTLGLPFPMPGPSRSLKEHPSE